MTVTARAMSPMFRPVPELVPRFSSDGEESFIDLPHRGKAQAPGIMINGKVDDFNLGVETRPESSLRTSSPTQITKHSNLLRRLTTKLRITTPPSSPSPSVLSFHPLSPNYVTTARPNSFITTDLSESALRAQGLIFPEDPPDLQRKTQDIYFSIVQNDQDKHENWMTEAERVKETWEVRHVDTTAPAAQSGKVVSPLRPQGPIYPDVLATPQFGRSRSTPDLTLLTPSRVRSVSRTAVDDAATESTSIASASRQLVLEPTQPSKLPMSIQGRHRTSSSVSSPPIFLSPQKWTRSTGDVSPLAVDVNAPFASTTSLASGSSRSYISSAGNSFLTDERLMHSMSAGFNSRRFLVSGDSSDIACNDRSIGATHNNLLGVSTRHLDIERTPVVVKRHTEDCGLAASIIVQVEGDIDVTRVNFPSRGDLEPNYREVHKVVSIGSDCIRPRAADLHRYGNAEDTGSFRGRTQRRKSFVEQSFQTLRKSITETISRARPRPVSKSPSSRSTLDTSQLPPSPTLLTSSPVQSRFPSSPWRGRNTGLRSPERTVSDLRRYTIEER